ncbi:hypothetical protein ACVGVM_26185 [Pseudonocardia bannensis]|uniref:Uncharacterized protein n=1 Tax=Pseudonocardia bannensis TaxID=630973 RepID=A0A848DDN6_9PSEU|nr:hypothetical protein [Pseudonocardia bannensis]NMH90720.1 hypothetical protein [Pseudonocardia bannensis]
MSRGYGPDFEDHEYHHHYHHYGPGGEAGWHDLLDWMPLLPGTLVTLMIIWALLRASGFEPTALRTGVRTVLRPTTDDPARARWQAAARRHAATSRAFVDFECDPGAVLRRPALADVAQPTTARFVEAFAESSALATEAYPGRAHAERFAAAAEHAERAWNAAVQAADRIRAARFAPGERALLDQVVKLLTVARESPHDAERRTAYQRARRRLAELERRSGWALPRPAATVLEYRSRGMLPPATPITAA